MAFLVDYGYLLFDIRDLKFLSQHQTLLGKNSSFCILSKIVATAVVMIYNFFTRKPIINKKDVPEEIKQIKETES